MLSLVLTHAIRCVNKDHNFKGFLIFNNNKIFSLYFSFSAYGGTCSLSSRDKQRKTEGFESFDQAWKRSSELKKNDQV